MLTNKESKNKKDKLMHTEPLYLKAFLDLVFVLAVDGQLIEAGSKIITSIQQY